MVTEEGETKFINGTQGFQDGTIKKKGKKEALAHTHTANIYSSENIPYTHTQNIYTHIYLSFSTLIYRGTIDGSFPSDLFFSLQMFHIRHNRIVAQSSP